MSKLREEPFRLLFPVGVVLAWSGVVPWLLFATGAHRGWPGIEHALTMSQAFLGAIAVGFLGTMLPRRTATAPLGRAELAAIALALAAIPVALWAGSLAIAEVADLVVLLLVSRFVVVRLLAVRARTPGAPSRPTPLSFVFVPAALLAGVTGAALLLAHTTGRAGWALAPGRSLAEEGLLEGLVLALAPMLAPAILRGGAIADPPGGRGAKLAWGALAAAFLASFVLQHTAGERVGQALRGLVAAVVLLGPAAILSPRTSSGLHRQLFRVALAMVPLGLLLAAAQPALRLGALHLTFIGGLSLLVFAVSFHVAFLHTGRAALAAARPWPVAAVAVLTLLATLVRLVAEQTGGGYFVALFAAASLWLLAAVVWGGYLVLLLARSPEARPA